MSIEYLTQVEKKLQIEIEMLKIQVKEQQEIIYNLYKRIAEINEVHKRRSRKQ